ncbi:MAG: flagellin [Planctomycetota bacterium]
MGLFIQTNVASLVAQNNLFRTQQSLGKNFERLSSGFRINSAADDAAGLGISKSINAQVRSLAVAERNANDGISMASTADGAGEQIHGILTRLRELAVQGSNGTVNSTDSANLNVEFQAQFSEIDRIAAVATFNGRNLLQNAASAISFQVGINNTCDDRLDISFGGGSSSSLGLGSANVANISSSQAAITTIDTAITRMSTLREGWGSAINRMTTTIANLQSQSTNLSASLSRIRDVNVAEETAALSRNQVLLQAGAAVLGQANQAPQLALSLLR